MENNINVEKSDKKKKFSFNGIKSRIVSVFSKSTVKGTLSDLNNTFATVSDDDIKKEEKINYKKKFDDVKHLKNGNVAVLKKDCFVALGASYRDFWGVYNKKGEQIIPVYYVEIKELENGIFACKGLSSPSYDQFGWTLYDEDGDIIVSHVDEYLLKDGNLFVNYSHSPYSSTYWMINKQGKRIFPKKYFGNLDSEEKIENKKDGFRPSGFEYRPFGFDYSLGSDSNTKGKPELGLKILEYKDGEVDSGGEEYYGMGEFKDGVMLARAEYTNKKGYFDEDFNLIVPGIYNEVGEFKDGVALLCKYNKDNGKKEYSFKKKNGESLGKKKEIGRWGMFETNMTYDDAHEFSEGLAAVNKDKFWGFIDNNGNPITNLEFTEVSDFYDGKAEVEKRVGGKKIKFWINKKGEYLLGKNDITEDFEKYEKKLGKDVINLLRLGKNYQEIEKVKEKIYAVKGYKGNVYRLIDIDGNQIDGTDFYSFKKLKNGMIKFEIKKDWSSSEWCLFDKDCKKVNDNAFIDIKEFEDGIAAVCVKVKVYGGYTYRRRFISENGEFINDKAYYKVWDFENGKAKVREEKDGEKYYIDVNGNRID